MTTESLIWTILPDGVDPETGELRSTIFVTPRLRAGGSEEPLKAFPTFHHWPVALQQLTFLAEIDGLGTVELERDDRHGVADPAVWDLFFEDGVFVVERPVPDLGDDRRVHSFPAAFVADEVLDLYARVAANHATDFPSIHDPLLTDLADDLGHIGDRPREEDKVLQQWFSEDRHGPEGRHGRFVPSHVARASRANAFALANRFYDRRLDDERLRDARGPIDPTAVPPRPERARLDFHAYVAAFGDYRHLLRLLGLAVDVRMPADPAFARRHRYRVVAEGDAPSWMNDDTATPWMNYDWYDDRWFVPATRDDGRHDVRDGQLLLDSEDFFRIHQIDIDGSALKMTNTASTVARRLAVVAEQGDTMAPTTSSLAALRGAGLTVTRTDTAETVVKQFDHTRTHADGERNGIRAELWADDVIRGYRWEAEKDGDGQFRSLVARVGTFTYHPTDGSPAVPVKVPPVDEGYVKGSSTTSVPGDKDLYLHEAFASWSGWSMVAPRPGGGVKPDDSLDEGLTPREQGEPLDDQVPLETSFRALPGSLPVLRFGHDYRLRARTVDLAANSVEADRLDDQHASPATRFLRWEPVPAPVLVSRRAFGEGESQLRMVIRSTAGVSVADYLDLQRVKDLAPVTVTGLGYADSDERWVVPPKTSQQLAELHGVFDDAIGSGDPVAIQAAFDVASRESGALPELVPAATLETPYLPDVLSRGVRFNRFFLEADYRRQDWPSGSGEWWDRQPIRVRLVEGTGPAPIVPTGAWLTPTWSDADGILTVPLGQAEVRTVRVSSAVDESDLELLGMYDRLQGAVDPGDWWARRHEALESRNWVLTPWVELTIVHAVEKPLADPVIGIAASGMQRRSGETFCVLAGTIGVHAKSTGRLDIDARWTEQSDDVTLDEPADGVDGRAVGEEIQGHAGDFSLEAGEDACQTGRDDVASSGSGGAGATHRLRHEFGDTRHRTVTYRATATTRFREYFPPAVTSDPSLITRVGEEMTLLVPSSRRPDPPDIAYVIPTFRWTSGITGTGRRLAPRLGRTRTRHCGLRVYLRRPWYSSGDDERLGVVIQDQPWITWPIDLGLGHAVPLVERQRAESFAESAFGAGLLAPSGPEGASSVERVLRGAGLTAAQVKGTGEAEDLRLAMASLTDTIGPVLDNPIIVWPWPRGVDPEKLLTRVGADPAFASARATSGPYISQFPLRSAVATGMSLEETSRAKVTVVAHTPRYDASRKLWYCDIEIDGGTAYQPFVRLALVRYQANSIEGHHISKVVLADFAQLLPRRVASLRPAARGLSVGLSGPVGVGHLGGTSVTAGSVRASRLVTAEVQRLKDGDDPDLDWVRESFPVELDVSLDDDGLSNVSWSGLVAAPDKQDGFAYRLLVQEFEIHRTDPGDASDPFLAVRTVASGPFRSTVRQRLVYADTFDL